MRLALWIGTKNDVNPRRFARLDLRWNHGNFDPNHAALVALDLVVWVGSAHWVGARQRFERARDLAAAGPNGQRYGFDAAPSDRSFGFRHPIVKRIRLIQSRTVLLNAPSPNVPIRVKIEGLAPAIDSGLEVSGALLVGVVAQAM